MRIGHPCLLDDRDFETELLRFQRRVQSGRSGADNQQVKKGWVG